MANGRLASIKIPAGQVSVVYTNTSGKEASINITATALGTTNATMSASIDTSSPSLNTTTTLSTTSSTSISAPVMYPDYSGTTNLHNALNFPQSGTTQAYTTWNGSAFSSYATYTGDYAPLKIDPYFLSNPSAYGRTSATIRMPVSSSNQFYSIAPASLTGAQFAQLLNNNNIINIGSLVSMPNANYATNAWDYDPYTNVGYSACVSPNYAGVYNFNSGMSTNPSSYSYSNFLKSMQDNYSYSFSYGTNLWYAPRVIASNGLAIYQYSGYGISTFFIVDGTGVNSNTSQSSLDNLILPFNSQGSWWQFSFSSSPANISWMEWHQTAGRYYLRTHSNSSIYSFTKGDFSSITKGSYNNSSFTSYAKLEGTYTPFMSRPLRIGASLWRCLVADNASGSNPRYVYSSDLVNWTSSLNSYLASSYPANIEHFYSLSDEVYYYTQVSTANIQKYDLGYTSGVNDAGTLEYNTSFGNYQRTGILVSNGDKLFVKNGGNTPIAITVMGYEG